jgi:putative transposase
MIEPEHASLSIRRQCGLVGLGRSSWYYECATASAENLRLMRRIDEEYLRHPFYGSRQMSAWLRSQGEAANRKRVRRLMRLMGLEAIYPKPRTTQRNPEHRVYPYLLRDVEITRPDHVWSTDITYVPLRGGYLYLAAIMDWYSRCVLSWRLSNTLDVGFCLEALEEALARSKPEIFNSDQGVQFTSAGFTSRLLGSGVQISMDGKGRALDNVFVERLWRTVKYEDIYLKDYTIPREAEEGLQLYFRFYNEERLHTSLGNRTPASVYRIKSDSRRSLTQRKATR